MKLKNIALGKVFATVFLASGLAFSGAASATTVNGTALQEFFNTHGLSAYNVNTSQAGSDETWTVSAAGSVTRTLSISNELVGYGEYSFGIYDVDDIYNTLELMDEHFLVGNTQSFSQAGNVFSLGGAGGASVTFSSATFGYYLEINGTTYYYSQPGLNSGGTDAMVAYKGDGTSNVNVDGANWGTFDDADYLLAWDINGNADFADWLVLVESVTPVIPPGVPEPGTFALLGIGLVGLGAIRRRRSA
jgi:hypothetical protein